MAAPLDELTASELSKAWGIDPSQITKWKNDGMPFRMKGGRAVFVMSQCLKWLREYEKAKGKDETAPDKAIEEARKMRAQADIAEMDRDERAGQLVRRESVESEQLKENIRARTKLLAIPNAHAQRLADDLGVPVRLVAKSLDRVVRLVLEELAREDDDETPEVADA